MIIETFGEYIHTLRVGASMTLTKLAAALDIDQSTLSKIENGKRPISDTLLPKLAEVFELDIEELRKEYFSEKIAEIIYSLPNTNEMLKLAEKKATYMKGTRQKQGKLEL